MSDRVKMVSINHKAGGGGEGREEKKDHMKWRRNEEMEYSREEVGVKVD